MPCYQSTNLPGGVTTTGRTSYTTEADCLQACREGACCEGTTCTVKPQCQCQGTGKVFKGVGTTCTPGMCTLSCSPTCGAPESVRLRVTIGQAIRSPEWDPTSPFFPGWRESCVNASPALFSGEYVLRFSGTGQHREGQPSSAMYRYSSAADQIILYWNCSLPFNIPMYDGFPSTIQLPSTGFLLINKRDRDCSASAVMVSQGYYLEGPTIVQTCQGQSLQMSNWTLGQTLANTGINVLYAKVFNDRTETLGGLSGVPFGCSIQISAT